MWSLPPSRVGQDQFSGQNQNREIRHLKTHYKTETKILCILIFCMRQDQDKTVSSFHEQDKTETILESKVLVLLVYKTETIIIF